MNVKKIRKELNFNFDLCFLLMKLLRSEVERVAACAATDEDSEERVLPVIRSVFGSREGLATDYARLSQQHIRLLGIQTEFLNKQASCANANTDEDAMGDLHMNVEDITALRGFLDQQEAALRKEES